MSSFLSAFSPAVLLPAAVNGVQLPAGSPQPTPITIADQGATGGSVGAARPTINFIHGTAESETIELAPGSIAFGGGGDDRFVLKSAGDTDGSEFLGSITDFKDGDILDLSQLGEAAAILGRQASLFSDRISIDFDGDGQEDGHLFASTGELPDLSKYKPMPMPEPIAWPIHDPASSTNGSIAISNVASFEDWLV